MKYIYIFLLSIFLISCSDEVTLQTKSNNKSIGLKSNELINSQDFIIKKTNSLVYSNADFGIQPQEDSLPFKKVNGKLSIVENGETLFEFVDSLLWWEIENHAQEKIDSAPDDNAYFEGIGYYLIDQKKWYLIINGGYEFANYILYNNEYKAMYKFKSIPIINKKGTLLFEPYFTGLGGFYSEWNMYSLHDHKIIQIGHHEFECPNFDEREDKKIKGTGCFEITNKAKWLNNKTLVLEYQKYEWNNQNNISSGKTEYMLVTQRR